MRPAVDVVVPYAGPVGGLGVVRARAGRAGLGPGDTLTVVDNAPRAEPPPAGVIRATGEHSSYHARNRGAERGENPWLLFLDADVVPEAGLLDSYFSPPPAARTAVVIGGLRDVLPDGDPGSAAARYQLWEGFLSTTTSDAPRTANLLVRRAAWAAAGGFTEGIRSGGDVDLWLRLERAGWELERRPAARAGHLARASWHELLRVVVRHGAGAAWVERRHPGTHPTRGKPGLACWTLRRLVRAARLLPRDRTAAGRTAVQGLLVWLDELGRRLPNRAPGTGRRRGSSAGRGLPNRTPGSGHRSGSSGAAAPPVTEAAPPGRAATPTGARTS